MDSYQISNFNFQLIRVAIVDDHTVVAEGFERLINASGVAGVTGIAYSVSGCWKLLAHNKTDVLLLDVNLPDGNGIDLYQQIKSLYPDLRVIILTSNTGKSIIKRALDYGVAGYIMKNATAETIIEGIQTVASGKKFMCDESKKLLDRCDNTTVLLSRRELELLRLIVAGKSGHEIADCLFLGYETIKSYRKRLMLKLNVTNTAELVRMAIEKQLI